MKNINIKTVKRLFLDNPNMVFNSNTMDFEIDNSTNKKKKVSKK